MTSVELTEFVVEKKLILLKHEAEAGTEDLRAKFGGPAVCGSECDKLVKLLRFRDSE